MNTDDASHQSPPLKQDVSFDLPTTAADEDLGILAANIARLETDLAKEREDRKEKEFIYIGAIAFLASVLAFKVLDNTILSMLMFLFELIILAGLAKRMGVDWAVQGIGWLSHLISKRFESSEEDK